MRAARAERRDERESLGHRCTLKRETRKSVHSSTVDCGRCVKAVVLVVSVILIRISLETNGKWCACHGWSACMGGARVWVVCTVHAIGIAVPWWMVPAPSCFWSPLCTVDGKSTRHSCMHSCRVVITTPSSATSDLNGEKRTTEPYSINGSYKTSPRRPSHLTPAPSPGPRVEKRSESIRAARLSASNAGRHVCVVVW